MSPTPSSRVARSWSGASQPEDLLHEHRRRDEEHDGRLDDRGEVEGDAGRGLHGSPPTPRAAKSSDAQTMPMGRFRPEQRDGDGGEADAGVADEEAAVDVVGGARDLDDTRESREAARDEKDQ